MHGFHPENVGVTDTPYLINDERQGDPDARYPLLVRIRRDAPKHRVKASNGFRHYLCFRVDLAQR